VAPTIPRYPLEENFTRQGITTIIASLHSTDQPWPLGPYMASLRMAPNVGFFAGHTWIRKQVMGLANRAPTPAELDSMRAMVERSMQDGALGLSTGLEYVPATYATTDEVITLAKVAARHGGLYVTHVRDEGPGVVASVEEVIRIAREAGLPAQINHHKTSGARQFGLTARTLAMIDQARADGLDVKVDVYPYTAYSTYSDLLFPAWSLEGGAAAFGKRAADPALRARILADMKTIFPDQVGEGPRSIQFRTLARHREYDGRTLEDWLVDHGKPVTVDAAVEAVLGLQLEGSFDIIGHGMDEGDVVRILAYPGSMIETDGDPVGFGQGFPHPRSYGSFPRVLARYVRDLKVLTLEDAIRKMTSAAADQINQPDRGRVREGAFADLVVFDADRIQDLATYTDPHRFPAGIVHVLVNGRPVIRDGALTGEMPGRVLRGPARPPRS
jgi:N-acyl-D-aspartate/D-glutamate deacylase